MDFFRKTPRRPPSTLLASPPLRRMSTPAGDRLATILENADGHGQQHRHSYTSGKTSTWSTKSKNGTLPRVSADTQPPPYAREWRAEDSQYFENEEKPGLRRRIAGRRGGIGRCMIIAVVVLAVIIALAVGLGIGLSRRNRSSNSAAESDTQSLQSSQEFPLGQYTFVTTLRTVQTDCTSDPATWRCYPYNTYQNNNSTAGLALFNWVINAASQEFPSNGSTPSTQASGTTTSLSVSSSRDPFSIPLDNRSLTYVNDNNNPRYTFNFTYSKNVVPTTAISTSNVASTCFFNQTQFTATLYLSNSRALDYPGQGLMDAAQIQGGYPRWPYAVEIREVSGAGQDVPACYEMVNGAVGQRTGDLMPQSSDRRCSCNYRNFDV
ncbi:hypothetical protein CAC42_988 [Sphaceloma murrayae]|uniref:Tat pathway signal sequence n=1 Tax=Sphaceloma murrayae TaxID=2082308 RepID=A0A2K1R2Z1_9PEZI|nr:hypothetical protein CAC42_988 [Sphaceloma murrayae]